MQGLQQDFAQQAPWPAEPQQSVAQQSVAQQSVAQQSAPLAV